jgi:molecular chaperone DnaK (HSP70)
MKKNLIIFPSLWEGIKELTNEQKGELFSALCLKFLEGEEPEIADNYVKFVYKFYGTAIADNLRKYEEICEKRAEARRGKTNNNKKEQTTTKDNKTEQKITKSNFVVYKEKEKEKEEEKEKVKEEEKEKEYNSLANAVRAFNSQLSDKIPMVVTFNEKRKQKLATRWQEFEKVGEPTEVWQRLIEIVKNSKFLLGEAGDWKCSFDWLIENSTNWLKVYEGHYNNSTNQKNTAFQGGNYNDSDWN